VSGRACERACIKDTKTFVEASKDEYWIKSVNEELDQIEKNNKW
jgi:hypothetical protein